MQPKDWKQWIIVGVLAVVACWLLWLMWGLVEKAQIAIHQANQTKAEYEALESRKTKLQGDLHMLATPRGQDAAIREAFGVAKTGEEVIVVVPPVLATTTPKKAWWQKVLGWF